MLWINGPFIGTKKEQVFPKTGRLLGPLVFESRKISGDFLQNKEILFFVIICISVSTAGGKSPEIQRGMQVK